MLSEIGRNAIIEGAGKLFKMSSEWVRPKLESTELINALPGKMWKDLSTPNLVDNKEVKTHDPSSSSTDVHASESDKPPSKSMRIPYFRGILREQVHMATQQNHHDYSDQEDSGRLPMLESWCAWKSIYATEMETDTDQMSNGLLTDSDK